MPSSSCHCRRKLHRLARPSSVAALLRPEAPTERPVRMEGEISLSNDWRKTGPGANASASAPATPTTEKKAVADLTRLTDEERAYVAKVAPNGTTTIEQVKNDKELQKILDKLVQEKAVTMVTNSSQSQTQQN